MKINKGDVAVVTGASRGLGIHIARALAEKGMSLVLAARSTTELESVAKDLRSFGGEVLTAPTDVSDSVALQALVDVSLQRFGRIDVLVNNAGFAHTFPYDRVEIENIQRMLAVNLTAPMILTRFVLPSMIAAGRGHVVNIASLAGVLPTPYEELYTASKHGLVGFTRSLRASAQDRGWPVSASAVCPGFMDDAGIFEDLKKSYGVKAPSAIGSMSAGAVGVEVVRAIEQDLPDVFISKAPIRFSTAMIAIAPRKFEALGVKMGTAKLFREIADARVKDLQGNSR